MELRKLRILIVDDDVVDIINIERVLKNNKIPFTLYIANDGLEALEFLQRHNERPYLPLPDLVLLDLNMPRMNGIELLDAIKDNELLNKLNVIVMTTSNDQQDISKVNKYNVTGYIVKSLLIKNSGKELLAINKHLGIHIVPNLIHIS